LTKKATRLREHICLDCRYKRCKVHADQMHGVTEAEAALALAKLGFTIVPKGRTKPVSVAELRRVVKLQKIDKHGYVTEVK